MCDYERPKACHSEKEVTPQEINIFIHEIMTYLCYYDFLLKNFDGEEMARRFLFD